MTISAFIPTYNEENRIETTLKTLQWCDEIVVLDKSSSDMTVDIAKRYTSNVFTMDNSLKYDSSEMELMLEYCNSDWILLFTASDVIHPKLADKIMDVIKNIDFHFDIIDVPFRNFVLGMGESFSPWYSISKPIIIKKSKIRLNGTGVHDAISFDSKLRFKISSEYCISHLTHVSVDMMMDRHLRYWRGEAHDTRKSINKSLKSVLGALYVVVRRGTFFYGYKGVALAFAYISYFMMSFVYRWEFLHSEASQNYEEIRSNILLDWDLHEKNKI